MFLSLFTFLSFLQTYNISRFESLDPYQVLGLKQGFSKSEIQKVYNRYVSQRIKATNPSERTIRNWEEIEFAYSILSNPSTKQLYDNAKYEFINVSDFTIIGFQGDEHLIMMNNMYGGIPEIYKTYGGHLVFPVEFSLVEFFKGATRKISLNTLKKCVCEDGTDMCSECFEVENDARNNVIDVTIPPGAPNFYRVLHEGVFEPDVNRAPHDIIFVAMERKGSGRFTRNGNDVSVNITLPLSTKIRGGTIDIKNVDGEKVTISLEQGENVVVKGKGFPFLGSPKTRGDLKVHFNIIYPEHELSEEQKQIVNSILPDDASQYE
ncbi:DnaJ domain containing protein [Tritrichomonas foetus]|uniref:DnaJ domain containing protein n=1 Tax=Tritrichomonas foetus TaxID=1144522 RepID=A0A1J4JE44_9EUKA|nr:DnaJ domain containing protein [Tritrichomonas foetus]|eukprot:OHS95709.1 DnaJ domain containing protein [Tritrichomonas foetus]